MYSEDRKCLYTFGGSGCRRYVGGMWAVQGLFHMRDISGLVTGHQWVIGGSPPGHLLHGTHTRPTGVLPASSSLYHMRRLLVSYNLNRVRSPLFDSY